MSLYQILAESSQYIVPNFYKKRFFKKQIGLNFQNVLSKKVEPELVWVKKILLENAVFIDIGANVGSFIFQLENHLKPKNIFAFEPNSDLGKRLKRLFPEINISQIALSDENSIAEFKIPVINGKKIHTRGTLQTDLKEIGEEKTILKKVKTQKLDDFVKEKNIAKIDFIKIDVEGNEMKTLRGAKNTIIRLKPILMVEMEQRHHQENLWNLISEIKNWGFSSHYLDRNSFKLKELTENLVSSQNAIFVKDYKNYINNIIFLPNL